MKWLIFSLIVLVALGESLSFQKRRPNRRNEPSSRQIQAALRDFFGKRRQSSHNKPTSTQRPTSTEATNDNEATNTEDVRVVPLLATASDLQPEQRLAYFREDIGINSMHWQWHLIFPVAGLPREVDKDRRGELFYYFHEQIIARYNTERLCNNLSRVVPYEQWDSPIPEAYFPNLDRLVASRIWSSRSENQILSSISTRNVSSLDLWTGRIYEAIESGIMTASNGTAINLREINGVDVLANAVEITTLAPNPEYYGLLHSAGHVLISRIHDPSGTYSTSVGVMGDTRVAMRDPVFYRWHSFINNVFVDFKETLPAYTRNQLSNPGVTVESVHIVSTTGVNQLRTFWQNATTNLTRGADFAEAHPIIVNLTYLNHVEFQYNIKVISNASRQATCRIFIAPKYNESGQSWPLDEQKVMFIELDTFLVNLTVGVNNIKRLSEDSSVTIPFNQTFRDVQTNRPDPSDIDASLEFNYCGCGWPHHLLIPKGNESGVTFEVFVMLSNFEQDILTKVPETDGVCKEAHSLCGVRNQLYPDARPMNYPFDRFPAEETLEEFLLPNMKVADVTIYHENAIIAG